MRDAAAGGLHVTVEQADGFVIMRAEGEVDLETADQLAAGLRDAGESTEGPVIADLIGVPFMDSSGLKVLLLASEELGGRLALVLTPGSPVVHLLEIADVHDRFAIHETAADAVRALGGG